MELGRVGRLDPLLVQSWDEGEGGYGVPGLQCEGNFIFGGPIYLVSLLDV